MAILTSSGTKLDKIASLDSILHGHFKLDCGVGRQLGNLILHLNHHSQTTMILLIALAFSNLEDQNEVRLVKRGVIGLHSTYTHS